MGHYLVVFLSPEALKGGVADSNSKYASLESYIFISGKKKNPRGRSKWISVSLRPARSRKQVQDNSDTQRNPISKNQKETGSRLQSSPFRVFYFALSRGVALASPGTFQHSYKCRTERAVL